MYLKKTPNTHGRIRLSIVDNYYDRVKKCSRQKTIESIGFLDELQKIYGDPIAHFQKRVDQLNEEKRAKQAPINFTFYDSDRLCVGDSLRKNFGYAALSKIYHELEIDKFLIHRQRYTKEKYDANTIMKMLVYSRILAPASKKASFDNREWFFEKSNYSLDDVYRCLDFFHKHKERSIVQIQSYRWDFSWITMHSRLLTNFFQETRTTVSLIVRTLDESKSSSTLDVSSQLPIKP